VFAPYTPLTACIGKELTVKTGGETHVGMLAGIYDLGSTWILVLTPMNGGGTEHHIPLVGSVVTVRADR
jgi:ribosomal 30S subunit maturation factor RimM